MLPSIKLPPKPDRADDAQYSACCLPVVHLGLVQMLPSVCQVYAVCLWYIYTRLVQMLPRLIAKLDARYAAPAEALQEGRPQFTQTLQ